MSLSPSQSSRLAWRTWTPNDTALAAQLWCDHEVTKLIDARSPLSPEQAAERLNDEIESQTNHSVQYWPIFLTATDEFVGCCGLRAKDPANNILEFGCHLRPAHQRKGLATEAGRHVIQHAFTSLSAAALFAGHNPANTPSKAMLEKLGFRWTHDELYPPTGLHHPSYLLTRERWQSTQQPANPHPPAR